MPPHHFYQSSAITNQDHTHLMTFVYPFAAATWSAVAPVLGCFFSLTDLLFSHLLASCNIWFSSSERAASASTPERQGMFSITPHFTLSFLYLNKFEFICFKWLSKLKPVIYMYESVSLNYNRCKTILQTMFNIKLSMGVYIILRVFLISWIIFFIQRNLDLNLHVIPTFLTQ